MERALRDVVEQEGAKPPSRASRHFSFMTETTFNCRDAWRKSSALSCSARPPGKDRTTQGLLSSRQVWKRWRLAPPAYELCVQGLRWYRALPARHAHLLCCWFGRVHFESHGTLIEFLRLHPEANKWSSDAITGRSADAGFRP